MPLSLGCSLHPDPCPSPPTLLPHSAHPPVCSWAHTPLPARALRLSKSYSLPIRQSNSALPLTPYECVLPAAAEASPRQHRPPASWPRHLHQPQAIQLGHGLSLDAPATWPPRYLGHLERGFPISGQAGSQLPETYPYPMCLGR